MSPIRDYESENRLREGLAKTQFLRLCQITPFCFFSLESTQDYLSGEMKSDHEGDVILSRVQTLGKGRENRRWFSDEGGLWFSMTLKPDRPHYLERLAVIAAIAIKETLETEYCVKGCEIKLPNDVQCDGRKIAGILVDGQVKGGETLAYLGVGVNLNNDPTQHEEVSRIATSYFLKTGRKINVEEFWLRLIQRLDKSYFELNQLK